MKQLLGSKLGEAVVTTSDDELYTYVISDVYKARMHKMYAMYYRGVKAKFALNVRDSPCFINEQFTGKKCKEEDGGIWKAMKDGVIDNKNQIGEIQKIINDTYGGIRPYGGGNKGGNEGENEVKDRADMNAVMPLTSEEDQIRKLLQASKLPRFENFPKVSGGDPKPRYSPSASEVSDAEEEEPDAEESEEGYGDEFDRENLEPNQTVWITEWDDLINASHSETNTMQLIQEHIVLQQAMHHFSGLDKKEIKAELLANALAKLVDSVTRINELPFTRKPIALFAGRRSSSRKFLFLQNLFCAIAMKSFIGTSATALNQFINNKHAAEFKAFVDDFGRDQLRGLDKADPTGLNLIGTHAHELQMVTQQVMGYYDKPPLPSNNQNRRACVTNLVSHLVFVLTHASTVSRKPDAIQPWYDISKVTALADTYGTPSFVAASSVAMLPAEFIDKLPPDYQAYIDKHKIKTVFDLIRVWRMDSGRYEANCKLITDVWKQKWDDAPDEERPPKPTFLHSYLESVDEVVKYSQETDPDFAPFALGFGSLLDGFTPFTGDDGKTFEILMSSIVMKAVQASSYALRHNTQLGTDSLPSTPCGNGLGTAGKLSDQNGKVQIDPSIENKDEGKFAVVELSKMRNGYLAQAPDAGGDEDLIYDNGKDKYYTEDSESETQNGRYVYRFQPITDKRDIDTINLNFNRCFNMVVSGTLNESDVEEVDINEDDIEGPGLDEDNIAVPDLVDKPVENIRPRAEPYNKGNWDNNEMGGGGRPRRRPAPSARRGRAPSARRGKAPSAMAFALCLAATALSAFSSLAV
jgi:hypothetical protein